MSTRLFGLLIYPCRSWRRFCHASLRRYYGSPLLGMNFTWQERGDA